jgi:hypothetical protein
MTGAMSVSDGPVILCPICGSRLRFGLTVSKRGKRAVSVVCPADGRHFRGFINDPGFVSRIVAQIDRMKVSDSGVP